MFVARSILRLSRAGTAAVSVLLAGSAHAQSSTPPAASPPATDQVEDIVVTAQRRSERNQQVPITISAVSAASIEAYGINNSQSLQTAVPGLIINRSQQNTAPLIRGVGTNSGQPGIEQPVSIYIDGVYSPIGAANAFNLTSIERIEVLKGPQGTLFGRNATGGVISITTRTPDFTPYADLSAGYGNYDTWTADAYVNAPLSDAVAFNIALTGTGQGDGWGRNVTTGEKGRRDIHSDLVRGKLLFNIDSQTSLTLTGQYSRFETTVSGFAPAPGATTITYLYPAPKGFYDTIGSNGYAGSDSYALSAKLVHELGWATLTDIVAYQHAKSYNYVDADGAAQPRFEMGYVGYQDVTTNELQLASSRGGPLTWLAGLFYMDHDALTNLQQANFIPYVVTVRNDFTTHSLAPFGQATLRVLPGTRITAGIRYTVDTMHITGDEVRSTGSTSYVADQRARQSKLTYRAAIDHDLSRDIMIFASYNRGFRAGIFNTQLANLPVLKPEVIDAFEGGIKTTLFDRHLTLNASAFHYDYSNIILRSFDPVLVRAILTNAAHAKMKGIDVDMQAALGPWRLTGGFEILDAIYDDYPNALLTTRLPNGNNATSIGSASGNRILQSPKFNGQIGIQRGFDLISGRLTAGANFRYVTSTFFDPDNRFRQGPVGLLSSTVKWSAATKRWDVSLWGQNLTNRKYYQGYNGAVTDDIIPAPPRTFGAKLGIHFQP